MRRTHFNRFQARRAMQHPAARPLVALCCLLGVLADAALPAGGLVLCQTANGHGVIEFAHASDHHDTHHAISPRSREHEGGAFGSRGCEDRSLTDDSVLSHRKPHRLALRMAGAAARDITADRPCRYLAATRCHDIRPALQRAMSTTILRL